MSYAKAMKHSRNVKKCRKQGNMYFGFNAAGLEIPPDPKPHKPTVRDKQKSESYERVIYYNAAMAWNEGNRKEAVRYLRREGGEDWRTKFRQVLIELGK